MKTFRTEKYENGIRFYEYLIRLVDIYRAAGFMFGYLENAEIVNEFYMLARKKLDDKYKENGASIRTYLISCFEYFCIGLARKSRIKICHVGVPDFIADEKAVDPSRKLEAKDFIEFIENRLGMGSEKASRIVEMMRVGEDKRNAGSSRTSFYYYNKRYFKELAKQFNGEGLL